MIKKQTYADWMRERNEPLFDYECPKCGWNALSTNGIDKGYCEIIHGQNTHTDFGPGFEIHVKCACPNCNTEFEYFDGSP